MSRFQGCHVSEVRSSDRLGCCGEKKFQHVELRDLHSFGHFVPMGQVLGFVSLLVDLF